MSHRFSLALVAVAALALLAVVVDDARTADGRLVAVHAVPSDARPVAGLPTAAAHELGVVDAWFAAQHPNAVGLRWARDASGAISVPTVQLPLTSAEAGDVDALAAALRATDVVGPGDVPVVYVDVGTDTCGTTAFTAFERVAAVFWLASCRTYPSTSTTALPQGATVVAAHELAHVLGAVPTCAPHEADLGHVDDDPRDLLYAGSDLDVDDLQLDVNNDDYFLAFLPDCTDVASHPLWVRA